MVVTSATGGDGAADTTMSSGVDESELDGLGALEALDALGALEAGVEGAAEHALSTRQAPSARAGNRSR